MLSVRLAVHSLWNRVYKLKLNEEFANVVGYGSNVSNVKNKLEIFPQFIGIYWNAFDVIIIIEANPML